MATNITDMVPSLSGLPVTLPREGAIELGLEQGVLVFRVSQAVQRHIEELLDKARASALTPLEAQELEQYEEIDDYLSFLNRLTRNLAQAQSSGTNRAS